MRRCIGTNPVQCELKAVKGKHGWCDYHHHHLAADRATCDAETHVGSYFRCTLAPGHADDHEGTVYWEQDYPMGNAIGD